MTAIEKRTASWCTCFALSMICAGFTVSIQAGASQPRPAQRSGWYLPEKRELAVDFRVSGAYVPEVIGIANDRTAFLEGNFIWNTALFEKAGLFGSHTIGWMWWGNVALLMFGHEVGARLPIWRHATLEAAYLGHRVDRSWVQETEVRPGGIIDNGAEIGSWWHFHPNRVFSIEPHLFGRVFKVYKDTQWVVGTGFRAILSPLDGHSFALTLDALPTIRKNPRAGVDKVTWNVIGSIYWRSDLTSRFGLEVGARLSTNLLVGEVPMLELKRSMIDEPMAAATIGLYFRI